MKGTVAMTKKGVTKTCWKGHRDARTGRIGDEVMRKGTGYPKG